MKKFFISMIAVVTALFMASCTKEANLSNGTENGEMISAIFAIETPGAISTRAIGDGTSASHVICSVFDSEGNEMDLREVLTLENKSAIYNVRLVKGQAYRIVFFAYNPGANAYDVTDLKDIKVLGEQMSNIETRDAFTNYVDISVEDSMNPIKEVVTLYRPFAQLNIGAYTDDIAAAKDAGVVVAETKVVVSDVYKTFSAYDNDVVGETEEMTFEMNVIPTETLKVKADKDGDGALESYDEYTYLALNYLLVGSKGSEKSLTNVAFTWQNADGSKTNTPETTFSNIPVQRNYRTNIIGYILTNPADFTIEIDAIFDGEYNHNGEELINSYNVRAGEKLYATLSEALAAGESDILLGAGTYDFNTNIKAKNIKITGASTDAKINIVSNGNNNETTATFENLTIVSRQSNYAGMAHMGETIFNGCVIENQYTCYSGEEKTIFNDCTFNCSTFANGELSYNVWTYGSNVDFNNCVFYCTGKSVMVYTEHGNVWETVNLNNCKFYASTPANNGKAAIEIDSSLNPCNVNIEGCTAEGFDLGSVSKNSLYNLKKGELVTNCNITVDGMKVIEGGSTYGISGSDDLAKVNEVVKSGEAATFTLTDNVIANNENHLHTYNATSDVTINGNNKTISSSSNSYNDFDWVGGQIPSMSTIIATSGNNTLVASDLTFTGTMSALMLGTYGTAENSKDGKYRSGTIELNNVNVKDAKIVSVQGLASGMLIYNKTNKLNNCSVTGTTQSELDTKTAEVYDVVFARYSNTVVNGGVIGTAYVWNVDTYLTVDNKAKIGTITLSKANINNQKKVKVTIKAGATVDILDISKYDGTGIVVNESMLVVEDGATLGKIVANGVEYASIAAFNARNN